jgi:hypothetical protein
MQAILLVLYHGRRARLFSWIELDSQAANPRDSFLAFACGHSLHFIQGLEYHCP